MTELIARLKQRKLVQWALAYIAFTFGIQQDVRAATALVGAGERVPVQRRHVVRIMKCPVRPLYRSPHIGTLP